MTGAYDYIVVGSGSAGSVVANRLSEDPTVRVLVVEAGGSERTPIITMPAALPFVYQSKRVQWGFRSGPEPELGGRTIDEKSGKVLGGASSISAMIYNRGNPLDYDGWAKRGLPTWDYAHCLPYFKRMETFAGGADDFRGGDGPMRVSRCAADHKLYDAFLASGEQAGVVIEAGRATGIEVADGSGNRRIACTREVVPADELRAQGIDVSADIPGVGRNLENHPGVDVQWGAAHEDSLTAKLGPVGQVRLAAEWALLRRGLGATSWASRPGRGSGTRSSRPARTRPATPTWRRSYAPISEPPTTRPGPVGWAPASRTSSTSRPACVASLGSASWTPR